MILVDFSQIISAAVYVGDAIECAKNPSDQSKAMIKHTIYNSLRYNFMAHKKKYGHMILACDHGSWRRDVFPNYKCQRRAAKEKDTSGINWTFVEEVKQEMYDEINKCFPFLIINVKKCEGDDIIGVMAKHLTETVFTPPDIFGSTEPSPILVISTDRDNLQLHKYKNVKQWSPIEKKLITPPISYKHSLIEKIVKGESGGGSDSIPNIKMGDNTFVDGIRQKPIATTYLQAFIDSDSPIDVCLTEEEKRNYRRNEELVSFEKIPLTIQESIISCYNEQKQRRHSKMEFMNYLTRNKMPNLLSQITDFYP